MLNIKYCFANASDDQCPHSEMQPLLSRDMREKKAPPHIEYQMREVFYFVIVLSYFGLLSR